MGITRPRKREEFIVQSQTNFLQKLCLVLTTSLVWLYSLTAIYVFIGGLFDYNTPFLSMVKSSLNITNNDIQNFFGINALILVGIISVFLFWRFYNKKRFGNLNRRTYPELTTDTDMLDLALMSPNDYHHLQNNRFVVFEQNPIQDLKLANK